MRAKSISNEEARKHVLAKQRGKDPRILQSALEEIGSGELLDEDGLERTALALIELKNRLIDQGQSLDVNTFDREACEILHRGLNASPEVLAQDGFWRWLAVSKFCEIIESRSRTQPTNLANYGIDSSVTSNRIAIIWFRAHMVFEPEADDPYHLAKQVAHTDFWESGIIRHRYAWAPNLARALVRFQYKSAVIRSRPILHSTSGNGIRSLYRQLRRLHSTLAFEYMDESEIQEILERLSSNLQPA